MRAKRVKRGNLAEAYKRFLGAVAKKDAAEAIASEEAKEEKEPDVVSITVSVMLSNGVQQSYFLGKDDCDCCDDCDDDDCCNNCEDCEHYDECDAAADDEREECKVCDRRADCRCASIFARCPGTNSGVCAWEDEYTDEKVTEAVEAAVDHIEMQVLMDRLKELSSKMLKVAKAEQEKNDGE